MRQKLQRPGTMPPKGGSMPQGGPDPEVMRAIMPDFPRWNRLFFQLDCIFALINLVLACTFFTYFWRKELIELSLDLYAFWYLILPSVLNAVILLVAAVFRRRLPQMDMRQNVIPVIAMLLMNLSVSMLHGIFFITLAIFCIPICMTTVYSSQKMCRAVTLVSLGGTLVTLVRQLLEAATAQERLLVFPQGLIAVCVLVTLGKVAHTVIRMTTGQKEKLIRFATDIKEAQRKAEAASEAKSLFLANMSHEIRTPINAILGMNEMILRETGKDQIREYAQSIYSAGSSLLYLVNDVLDISKIESDKLELTENIYDLSSFIHDCYIMVAEKAEKKQLELNVSCDPQLPSRLKGDESRLRQVVTNLLSNAAKYTEKGSITLSFDRREQEGRMMLVVTVKDTGIGIKKENMDKLFTQFTRFDMEKNRNIEGTGLGLALAKRLTDLMGGTIEMESIYGVGTSVTLTVPQEVVDSEPIGDFQEKYLSVANKNETYRQSFEAPEARILAVDDVAVNLKVIVNLLKSTRIKVDTATSGRRCLEMAAQTAYDLIFMDHMMPEMDGVETYAAMRKLESSLNKDTPVIMLTANAITGVREQFLEAGFADYLSKPVSGDKLEDMILKYLPKEKCRTGDFGEKPAEEAVEAPDGGANHPKPLRELRRLYPKVDLTKGLTVCADSYEVYLDVLQAYAEQAEEEPDKLSGFLGERNAYEYRVCVHGVKSSSLSVGFSELAAQALTLENAAREEDWDVILATHDSFIAEYQTAAGAVRKALDL